MGNLNSDEEDALCVATEVVDLIEQHLSKMSVEGSSAFLSCLLGGVAVHLIGGSMSNVDPTMRLYVGAVNAAQAATSLHVVEDVDVKYN